MKEIPRQIYENIREPFINFCINNGISAYHVTVFNHIITLTLGCYAFVQGHYIWGLIGLSVMFLNGFLDFLDGDIAKKTGSFSPLGIWLDSGFDVVIQNAVMGAIAIGCFKNGLSIWWIILFFISNASSAWISFNYNQKFGFDSYRGNEIFRTLVNKPCNWMNKFVGQMIDPTMSFWALINYTYRYFIVIGVVFNILPLLFINMTIICTVRWIIMYVVYACYVAGEKRPYLLRVLATLDEERQEYYALRSGGQVRENNS